MISSLYLITSFLYEMFPKGEPLSAEAQKNFIGKVYLSRITSRADLNCPIANVVFEAGARNSWHKHSRGQILLAISGRGLYQEKGKEARLLVPGDVVEIPPNVEHWHGATAHIQFSHLAITPNPKEAKTEWLQPVTEEEYAAAQPTGNFSYTTHSTFFPIGEKNPFGQYFIGQSYLAPLATSKELNCPIFNVTFEPGCRNNWHKHEGGQLLICVAGRGLYQERGHAPVVMTPGTVVEIPPNAEHWHGATADSWFSHAAIETNPGSKSTWLEAVDDEQYKAAQPPSPFKPEVLERLQMFKGTSSLNKYDTNYLPSYANFAFGDIYAQTPLIDQRTRFFIILASLITTQSHAEFRTFVAAALENGVTPEEVKEICYHCVAYIGFGKVHDSLLIVNEYFEAHGITTKPQCTTTPENRLVKGREIQDSTFGPYIQKNYDNSPKDLLHIQIDLSANCFGDHYTRSTFDINTRELLTYAILISHGGCEPQVKGHLNGNKSVGNSRDFMIQATTSLIPYIGYPRTLNAIACINEVYKL